MKRIAIGLKILLISFGSIVASAVVAVGSVSVYHNCQLAKFEKNVRNIPVPKNTVVIASEKMIGAFGGGNINRIDTMVLVLVRSPLGYPEFVSQLKRSVFLEKTFTAGKEYLSIAQINRNGVYQVVEKDRYQITDSADYSDKNAPFDAPPWSPTEIYHLKILSANLPDDHAGNYYVITVADSVHSGWHLLDYRAKQS